MKQFLHLEEQLIPADQWIGASPRQASPFKGVATHRFTISALRNRNVRLNQFFAVSNLRLGPKNSAASPRHGVHIVAFITKVDSSSRGER